MSITLPIVHPVILELGVDPIHFAMLVVVAIEIGLLTPPVGLNVYTVKSVANQMPEARDVSLEDVFRGTLLFLILSLLALLVLLLVPDISTFLPRVMLGR
jgi:TRAP-type C4-dicarboxylate transport system permease large subunit